MPTGLTQAELDARLIEIRKIAKRFQAKQNKAARFRRQERVVENYMVDNPDKDDRFWTDEAKYAEQYYGETFRATTRFDNDWD